jgi:hypothetical protein
MPYPAGADDRLELLGTVIRHGLLRRPRSPAVPTRLMAGLAILKHMHDLSDEALCERWVENPYIRVRLSTIFSYLLLLALGLDQDWNSESSEKLAEPYFRAASGAGAKIPHSGEEEFPGRQDQSILAAGKSRATGSHGRCRSWSRESLIGLLPVSWTPRLGLLEDGAMTSKTTNKCRSAAEASCTWSVKRPSSGHILICPYR